MISYNGGLANWPDCRPSVVQWSKSIGRSSASGSSNVDMPDDDRRDANQPSPISDEDSRGAEANGTPNGKNRTKLFDQLMAKSKIKQDMEDREVEQDYLEARRLTLEKAQADLLAGFGVGFPVLAGLHYVPARHPLLPTAMQSQSELLNLKMIRSSPNINGSGNPSSGSSAGGTAGCRESPLASSSSPEPEDLSMHTSPRESHAMKEQASPSGSINANSSAPQSWSFEEQFKQLYELSEESKRKDFLDELFSFMQKRGTPVTRIPIMAKQVLDLYELYKLVVSHGGLVEVINKKMWREITKGLNLPSSITSAAFTLRTQYMKYLYPYECEKEKLSSPAELQSAIDGNRREGRRSGYHPYSQISPTLLPRHHMNGGAMLPEEEAMVTTPSLSQQQQAFAAAYREQALALEAAQRQFERNQRDKQRLPLSGRTSSESNDSNDSRGTSPLASAADATPTAPLPPKRAALEEAVSLLSTSQDRLLSTSSIGIPTAHIKVTSRNDGRSTIESSLVVSMEINGVMYQGVLFAQPAAVRMNGGN